MKENKSPSEAFNTESKKSSTGHKSHSTRTPHSPHRDREREKERDRERERSREREKEKEKEREKEIKLREVRREERHQLLNEDFSTHNRAHFQRYSELKTQFYLHSISLHEDSISKTKDLICREYRRHNFLPAKEFLYLENEGAGCFKAHVGFKHDYEAYMIIKNKVKIKVKLVSGEYDNPVLQVTSLFQHLIQLKKPELEREAAKRSAQFGITSSSSNKSKSREREREKDKDHVNEREKEREKRKEIERENKEKERNKERQHEKDKHEKEKREREREKEREKEREVHTREREKAKNKEKSSGREPERELRSKQEDSKTHVVLKKEDVPEKVKIERKSNTDRSGSKKSKFSSPPGTKQSEVQTHVT